MADVLFLLGGEEEGEGGGAVESVTEPGPPPSSPPPSGIPQSPPHVPMPRTFTFAPVPTIQLQPPPEEPPIDSHQVVSLATSHEYKAREFALCELPRVLETTHEVDVAIEALVVLAQDSEAVLRGRVGGLLPEVIRILQDRARDDLVESTIIPLSAQLLVDASAAVRGFGKGAFLTVMRACMHPNRVAMVLAPTLEKLTADVASEELKTECLAFMSETVPYADMELVRQLYVPVALNLVKDPIFHVRKACCSTIAHLLQSAAERAASSTVDVLLSVFEDLCVDEIWGVRKACAESLPVVAGAVSPAHRAAKITRTLINLANDQSRWVRGSAFKSLGGVIATFAPPVPLCDDLLTSPELLELMSQRQSDEADPQLSQALRHNSLEREDALMASMGTRLSLDEEEDEEGTGRGRREPTFSLADPELEDLDAPRTLSHSRLLTLTLSPQSLEAPGLSSLSAPGEHEGEVGEGEEGASQVTQEGVVGFAEASPTEIEAQAPMDDSQESTSQRVGQEMDNDLQQSPTDGQEESGYAGMHLDDSSMSLDGSESSVIVTQPEALSVTLNAPSTPAAFDDSTVSVPLSPSRVPHHLLHGLTRALIPREAVPHSLISLFTTMPADNSVRVVDSDVVRLCGYIVPAVTWALGPDGWPLIRQTYFALAANNDWKVRSTLAHSIHALAQILGRVITEKDLVPYFDSFLKDWDDVRFGVVRHFSSFLRVISPSQRNGYLPLLVDLKEADEVVNWRFRRLLAVQLAQLPPLFNTADVATFLCPLALALATDKIACVRARADVALACLGGRLLEDPSDDNLQLMEEFANQILARFAQHKKSLFRQSFVHICYHMSFTLRSEHFSAFFLDALLTFQTDPVPNVRLMLARVLSQRLQIYLEDSGLAKALETIEVLKQDPDRDTNFFAGLQPGQVGSLFTNEMDVVGEDSPPPSIVTGAYSTGPAPAP